MLYKRIVVCSTVAGGCFVAYFLKNSNLNFYQGRKEISNSEDFSTYIYLPNSNDIDFVESIESTWSFWKRKSLPVYWKLLMLSKSKDLKARHKAIESLSKLTNLEKWQYNMVAQACDVNTAVGLARSFSTSSDFFLPPPFRDLDKGNPQYELYLLLSSLKFSDKEICLQNQLAQILNKGQVLFKTEFAVDLDVEDPSVIYHSQQKKKIVFLYDKLCLEVLLVCSAESHHRKVMRRKEILKLFLKVLESHKNDVEIKSLIAQIIANLALDQNFKNTIYRTGWIGILSEWKKSPSISISLPAAKALANLDNDDSPHPLYADGIYILNPLCRLSETVFSADVIFIHGLLGATFWTWRQCDSQNKSKAGPTFLNEEAILQNYSMCWPKDWLATDVPSLRLISVDYKTCISNWGLLCPQRNQKDTIQTRAKELIEKLLLSRVGEKPIIWIAHSMGGLIVKQILTEAIDSRDERVQSMLKKTAGLIFYSVPHMGSELATKMNSASLLLQLSSDIAELQKGSASLLLLHKKFKDVVEKYDIPVISFGETKKSRWGLSLSLLVPLDSADPGFGEFYPLPVDHLSACKPVSAKSADYLKVVDFLKVNLSRIYTKELQSNNKTISACEISKIISLIP